ncbi:uncharacterized protein DSM5745_09791 [Aspergillus mulundensis]|uniref:Apple domain-containing protein n=1 Tax=Aspergillus mulundensis TaxID=1810919 RepID=A0A3D8QRV8_9EURO|nr:Uncharacterized protein DSM5745_09791 [Aspergillus mulundensis]RDW64380.1 Uncharacterized protein DSM5745_09791 [Aspergillus mulundensis]
MSLMFIPLVAGLLLGQASAKVPVASSSPVASSQPVLSQTQASVHCHTKLGTSSISGVLPTSTITHTRHDPTPVIITSTTQGTVTETPPLVTVTITSYITSTATSTADPSTDIFSTTSTEFTTSTTILTLPPVIETIATTVTSTSTSTSTIPSPADFTPLADTLVLSAPAKRSLLGTEEDEHCDPWLDDYQYPQAVECHEKLILRTTSIETITAAPITSTAATSTTTTTITSTITTTTILVPTPISTTLSYSTTSTLIETATAPAETSTTTTTNTIEVSTSTTMHAACATNNVAPLPFSSEYGRFEGQYTYLLSFTHIPGESLTVGNTASAYDCCVSCQESDSCAMSYYNHVTDAVKYCYLIHSTTCAPETNYAKASIHSGAATIQMSNGRCGRVYGVQA